MPKKKPTQKHTPRMSREYRSRAVYYHPQFIKDFSNIVKLAEKEDSQTVESEARRLDEKWGVTYMTSLYSSSCGNKDLLYKTFEVLYKPVLRLPYSWYSPRENYTPLRMGMMDWCCKEKAIREQRDRYLALEIDLWENKNTLMKEIESIIDARRKNIKRPKGRTGKTTYDPWKVYDLRKKGKKYEQIVKEIDPYLKNKKVELTDIDKARKAYRKAYEMIKAVTPSQ